jgi:excisionase family DNA binding protein
MDDPMEKHFSLDELHVIFGPSKTTWRREVARGRLKAVRVGRQIRVSESALERYLASRQIPSAGRRLEEAGKTATRGEPH